MVSPIPLHPLASRPHSPVFAAADASSRAGFTEWAAWRSIRRGEDFPSTSNRVPYWGVMRINACLKPALFSRR